MVTLSGPGGGLEFIDALPTSVPLSSIPTLAADTRIAYISLDRPTGANLEFATPAVNATAVHSLSFRGAGIGIAVIDSGVRKVEDLRTGACTTSRVVYEENFVNGENTTDDLYGHGTHVAGIIAGNGKCSDNKATLRSRVFLGVAPEANIINLRALNAQGAGTDSSVLRAIGKAIRLRNTYNIRVINLSLGRKPMESYQIDPLGRAVAAAWQSGIFVAVAAGNRGRDNSRGTNGYGTIGSPGNHPLVLTVGAMRDMGTGSLADDLMASYSSKGPTAGDRIVKPDLVAPGNEITAALAPGTTLANTFAGKVALRSSYLPQDTFTPGSYINLSGTSMATPMAAGAAALYIQKWGISATPDAVKAALMKTAVKSFPRTSIYTVSYTHLTLPTT
jgi:serine protease AprX